MLKKTVIRFIIFFLLTAISGCKTTVSYSSNASRLIYNNDGSEILGNNWFDQRPLTIADVNQYVDMIAHSQVTTFMICSGSDFFYYPSKYGRLIGDDKNATLSCINDTALYKALRRFYNNAAALEKQGTDIIEATVKRAKEKQLEAFITYRMNDLHFADTSTHCSLQYSDFWSEHPEFWTNDTTLAGWNSRNALDFAHKEVRDHKLNIIREQLEKYGALIDGYELDFMRFIVYFKKSEAEQNAPLITDLIQSVKKITDSVGKIHNKKILLTARVPSTISDCKKKGLDVQTWVKLGLIDFITLGVHWRGEPAMPVANFKKAAGQAIPVYATLDDGGYNPREVYSHGMYRGMASHALAQGAAGLNLFNYFFTAYNKAGGQLTTEQGTVVCRIIAPELLQELGSLKTLEKRNKIYTLSDGATSYDLTPNSPLPLKIHSDNKANIFVGDDVKKNKPKEIVLFVRTGDTDSCSVSVNGYILKDTSAAYPELYDRRKGLSNDQKVWAFAVPHDYIKQGNNELLFSSASNNLMVLRIELALNYGDIKNYGYF
ncbi:hypothetical protein DC498_22380 [Terrimonas sp.]|nr:hypothetical protein DC498_23525 [Terrimonas sp.]PVD49962.1 hypothetical protein DC498_22380 [Terrimonas sp.]